MLYSSWQLARARRAEEPSRARSQGRDQIQMVTRSIHPAGAFIRETSGKLVKLRVSWLQCITHYTQYIIYSVNVCGAPYTTYLLQHSTTTVLLYYCTLHYLNPRTQHRTGQGSERKGKDATVRQCKCKVRRLVLAFPVHHVPSCTYLYDRRASFTSFQSSCCSTAARPRNLCPGNISDVTAAAAGRGGDTQPTAGRGGIV